MPKRVYIIIVTYNAFTWLDYCLTPFAGRLPPDWKVIVVDNASADNTVSTIRKRFSWVTLIESETNLGFGRANNIAMRKALADNADYVFLLNQDARISVESIERLIDIQFRHPESLITTPVHLAGSEEELDLPFSQSCISIECPGLLHDALRGRMAEIYFSSRGMAAAWLLSRKCLELVGGFNPYFYHYGEDDDYVNRARHQGGKVGIVPGVFATHNRKQENSTRPLDYKFLRKLVKYTDPRRKRPGKPAVLSLFFPMLLLNMLRGRYGIVSHYAKVMGSMLRGQNQCLEQQKPPYL